MLDVQTIGVLVTAASVSVAAIYYMFTLRINVKTQQENVGTRHAQLFMQTYSIACSEESVHRRLRLERMQWKDYDDFMTKYASESNPEGYVDVQTTATYYQGIGVLVQNKLFTEKLVHDMMGSAIISYWEKFEPIFKEYRKRTNNPYIYPRVEYLYGVVKKYREGLNQSDIKVI